MTASSAIVVTGGHGMLGKALRAELRRCGQTRILAPCREELDLTDGAATRAYFMEHRPHLVFHLASVVFGLLGNMKHQVRAISESTLLNHNVLMACADAGVEKMFFAGSVASYPFPYKSLPLTEDMLWQGVPHDGEFGYAHAKRHALAYLEVLKRERGMDFFCGLLTNLYGPEDRFDATYGHVVPSLIRKMHQARHFGEPFKVWGDGSARRDFLHVHDAARLIVRGTREYSGVANVSSGITVSIRDIVAALAKAADYRGEIVWQTDKPVGIPERSVSDAVLRGIGIHGSRSLEAGIQETWDWFEYHFALARS